jgi:UDPglucose 6-dehydrogenase
MTYPKIAFVGMTHLGLTSAVAASKKGFQVICFDPNVDLINNLKKNKTQISEPQLIEMMHENRERLTFSSDPKLIESCPIIYVAPDVSTNDQGHSDLSVLNRLLDITLDNSAAETVVVVLSQVPPGFTRSKLRKDRAIYYQVETLIFGQAINRALFPERYIVGCLHPADALPLPYQQFLEAHDCPILRMRFESAELAKISINMCLVASVSTANILAELCEEIGADWSEIIPALKLDRRIGQYAYLNPGLGISGGNLERDLATVINYANQFNTDCGVVNAWVNNSSRRKDWIWLAFKRLVAKEDAQTKKIGILGLTYKENTHSLKNSPALVFLSHLKGENVVAYDPVAAPNAAPIHIKRVNSVTEVLKGIDVLVISTAWPEFKSISTAMLIESMAGNMVIDPYGVLDGVGLRANGFTYLRLGMPL